MNKLLIFSNKKEEWKELEKSFKSLIEKGGELFFVQKEESVLDLLTTEKPTLLILDSLFYDGKESFWEEKKKPLVVVRERTEQKGSEENTLFFPLEADKVLDMVSAYISWEKEPEPAPL